MKYSIEIEAVVANAFIETWKMCQKQFLSYQDIDGYGKAVLTVLEEKGHNGSYILPGRYSLSSYNFAECFEKTEFGVTVKESVQIENLIDKFRGYLPLDVLLAFTDKRCVNVLMKGERNV